MIVPATPPQRRYDCQKSGSQFILIGKLFIDCRAVQLIVISRLVEHDLRQKGHMNPRIIELAIEALEARKAGVDEEIQAIRGRRTGTKPAAAPVKRRRKRTAAQRKAQSLRMKAYWAKKRAGRG
jgi:hypothetical protein